jgi:hypothetical protein
VLLPISPMRLLLVFLFAFALAPLSAQQPATRPKTTDAPKPKVLAPPAPTPPPKKGFFGRVFRGREKVTPPPAPTPTPAPVTKPKPKPRPKPVKPSTDETEPPKPSPETKPPTEAATPPAETTPPSPAPAKPPTEAAATPDAGKPAPKPGKGGRNAKKGTAEKPAEVLDDATKYKNAHTAAVGDPQIKDLKAKADSALAEDEAHRATVAYNKALFRKIRDLDPSLDAYVDKLEQAMMKRLNAEKKGE